MRSDGNQPFKGGKKHHQKVDINVLGKYYSVQGVVLVHFNTSLYPSWNLALHVTLPCSRRSEKL